MLKTITITVRGKVQGVFFRHSAKEKANELAITGEVRNNDDGTVTIVATGTPEQLEEFIAWCWQGPPKAKVEEVETEECSLMLFLKFEVVRGGD